MPTKHFLKDYLNFNLSISPSKMSFEKILLYFGIPYFTISIIIELLYARWRGDNMRMIDVVSSLSSGMTNILKESLGLGFALISYEFLLKHFQLVHWDTPPVWMYFFCFLAIDFSGYWVHRIEHQVNFFWNHHIIHHSSEEFNLACALRQSFSDFISYFTIFSLPMALLGVPLSVIAIIAPVQLFAQFWYHTRYIKRIGFLEKIIITPSHHRVHHAMNDEYLDKNFGQIFIFWDKLFGTYQEELPEVEPVYGVKRAVKTWNPYLINFKHLYLLITDAWHAKSWKDKLRIWFMPTGWRPADVAEKYPVPYVHDVSTFEKHDPVYSSVFVIWSFLQMAFCLLLMCFLFYRIDKITHTETLLYGGFILVSVFAYTSVMDKKAYGIIAIIAQAVLGIVLIIWTGDWFGMSGVWSAGPTALIVCLIASAVASIFFHFTEFSVKEERDNVEVQ
ncbi:MAG: sterol desaturase family protein [Bacteroidetes bacterium]|nr:sterol desaturase family protein [Bacteroidota bacterium]